MFALGVQRYFATTSHSSLISFQYTHTPLFQFKRPDKDLMFILVKKFQLKNKVFFFKETNSKAAKLFNNPTGLQKTERSCKGMVALRLWRWMDPHIFSQYLSRVHKRQRHNAWGMNQGSSNKKHGWGAYLSEWFIFIYCLVILQKMGWFENKPHLLISMLW